AGTADQQEAQPPQRRDPPPCGGHRVTGHEDHFRRRVGPRQRLPLRPLFQRRRRPQLAGNGADSSGRFAFGRVVAPLQREPEARRGVVAVRGRLGDSRFHCLRQPPPRPPRGRGPAAAPPPAPAAPAAPAPPTAAPAPGPPRAAPLPPACPARPPPLPAPARPPRSRGCPCPLAPAPTPALRAAAASG